MSNPTIQFVVYEKVRAPMALWAERRGKPINSLEFFVMGAIAKAVATVFTYPLQIAQSRLRAQKATGKDKQYHNTADCIMKVARKDGIKGLFKGMEAKLWQTVLTAAFQFLTYEKTQALVFALLLSGGASKPVGKMSIGK